MFQKLYENRNTILVNIWSLVDHNKFILGALAVLICLLAIYAILRISEYRKQHGESADMMDSQVARLEPFTNSMETPDTETGNFAAPDLEIRFLQPGTPEYTNLIAYLDREYLPKLNSVNIQARGQATFPQIRAQYLPLYNLSPRPPGVNLSRRQRLDPGSETQGLRYLGGQGGNSGLCEQVTEDEQSRVHELITDEVLAKLTGLNNQNKKEQTEKMSAYLRKWLSRSWIAKGRPWLEAGMPHTHGPCIIMSHDWLSSPTPGTLVHELMHVHQRMNPADFDPLYAKWGFQRADGMISGLEAKYPLYRVNPDGLDPNWIWTDPTTSRVYWIASLFNSVDPDSLKDTQYMAFPLASGESMRYTGSEPIPLAKFTEFQNMFGIQNNNYHPNEIAAEYADHFLSELLNLKPPVAESVATPGYRIFREWFGGHNPQADTFA